MIFKHKSLFTLKSLILCLLLSQNSLAQDIPMDAIAAVVNNDIIMVSEVKETAAKIKDPKIRQLPQRQLFKEVLDKLIMDKVQVQHAKQIGIKIDDAALDQAMTSIAKQNNLDLQQFRVALIKEGYDYKTFRESIRDQLYRDTLQKRQQGRNASITESEVDDLIKSESKSLSRGTQYHIIDIHIPNKYGNSVQQFNNNLARAGQLRKRLLAKSSISDGVLKAAGATQKDLGFVSSDKLSPAFIRALSLMEEGELSNVVRDARGLHILKLVKRSGTANKKSQQVKARHILISKETPQGKVIATKLRNQILAGESFAKLAKQYSADKGSAKNGGELPTTSPSSYVPPFANAVSTLPVNTISQPIETKFGWHIIEVLERSFSDQNRDAIKLQAQSILGEQKKTKELNSWLQGLRDAAFIEYRVQL